MDLERLQAVRQIVRFFSLSALSSTHPLFLPTLSRLHETRRRQGKDHPVQAANEEEKQRVICRKRNSEDNWGEGKKKRKCALQREGGEKRSDIKQRRGLGHAP